MKINKLGKLKLTDKPSITEPVLPSTDADTA